MKILFIGHYRDFTGWSQFAQNQILGLDAAGFDVACRAIKLNNVIDSVPERILELEERSFSGGADIVIQNTLPHYAEYSGRFKKNIVYYMNETSNFRSSTWANHINLMDEAWVPCLHNFKSSVESGVKKPIKVVPMATDVTKYQKSYPALSIRDEPQYRDKFIFYTIGEFNKRKNLGVIIKAFHTEFDVDEPVELMIKTTPAGMPGDPQEFIDNSINEVKKGLKLFNSADQYKKEIVIFQNVPNELIPSVHMTGDCFVSAAHGEGFGIGSFDAMGFGKSIIAPEHTGFLEYLNHKNSWLLPAYEDCVWGFTDTFQDIYTGRESWFNVSVLDMRRAMREVYENRELRKQKSLEGMNQIYNFSYDKVGNIMKSVLEE